MGIMKKFAERKYLSQKNLVHYHDDDIWPFLHIENPVVVARFFALLKQEAAKNKDGWVYCRGQNSCHKSMLPSLFRGKNLKQPLTTLLEAEEHLMNEIRSNFNVKRFQKKTCRHYYNTME